MKNLPNNYYKWHKIDKNEVFKMILIKTGDIDNINKYSINPIGGDKTNIAQPIIVNNLHKVFLPCTIIVCSKLTNNLVTLEHHQVLELEIKNKPLKELTAATAEGLQKLPTNRTKLALLTS